MSKGVVFKQSYKSRNLPSTPTLNRKHLIYIATRPGATHNPGCSFGLWGRLPGVTEPENINRLKLAVQSVTKASKERTLYRAIISVDKNTAKHHGLFSRKNWERLVNEKVNVLADQMGIKRKDFCWCASMHYAKGHPHVHILYWDNSDAVHQEYVPEERFEIMAEKVRAEFGREIYRDEIRERQNAQSDQRKALRLELRALLREANLAEALDLSHVTQPVRDDLTDALADLAATVPTKGALKYGYMPAEYKTKLDAFSDKVLKISDFQRVLKQYETATREISNMYGNGEEKREFVLERARAELRKEFGNEVLQTIKQYRKELTLEAPVDHGELQVITRNVAAAIVSASPLYNDLLKQMPKERTPMRELLKDKEFKTSLYKLTDQVCSDIRVNTRLNGYIDVNSPGLTKDEADKLRKDIYSEARRSVAGLIEEKLQKDAHYPEQARADILENLLIRLLGEASRGAGQQQARRDMALRRRRELSKTAQQDRREQQKQGGAWQTFEP